MKRKKRATVALKLKPCNKREQKKKEKETRRKRRS